MGVLHRPSGRKITLLGLTARVGLLATYFATNTDAVTLETTSFLSIPTYFNGFEGFGTTGTLSGDTYSEGGITVYAPGDVFPPPIGGFPTLISNYSYWNGMGTF